MAVSSSKFSGILSRSVVLFGPSLWAGLLTATKAVVQLIILKYVAVVAGPSALGIVGQTMGLTAILQNFSGGGISNGVIRNLSIHFENTRNRADFISRSFTYGAIFCGITLAVCTLGSSALSQLSYGSVDYRWVFILAGFVSLFAFIGSFSQALLTARSLVKQIFWGQALAWVVSLPLLIYLAHEYSTQGMVVGIVLTVVVQSLFMGTILLRQDWLKEVKLKLHVHRETTKILLPFTLLSFVSGLISPAVFILLRSNVESVLGWESVGYWQALLKISEVCLSFISLVIASTFYPRVSTAKNAQTAIKETAHFVLSMLPLLVVSYGLLIIFGRETLTLVFSSKFANLDSNLRVLLFGDIFRTASWALSYLLMARNRLYLYLGLETLFSGILYLGCSIGLHFGFSQMIWMQSAVSILSFIILSITTFTLYRLGKL